MVWVTVHELDIARVHLVREGVTPTPKPPVPVPVIEAFFKEHADLKRIIDRYGCVDISILETDSKLSPERFDKHVEWFKKHDAVIAVTPEGICGKDALRKLKERLEVEL